MSKIAFVFPGQGAQYTGMAKDFYEKYAVSREVFESASKASGLDVKALCFEENDRLNITEYTQIAMLTAEIAILRAVEEAGIRSQVNAGLSLGEYGALVASGVMKEEDAFTVVRKRGIFMQEAYPTGGAMSAVLGTDAELIEKICNETQGIVSIANYNCPGQIVITGEKNSVEKAAEKLKERYNSLLIIQCFLHGLNESYLVCTSFIRGFYKKTCFFTVFFISVSGLLKQIFH